MIDFVKSEAQPELRLKYLESLPEFQELYMEMMAADSTTYLINTNSETIGYFLLKNKSLVEYYLDLPFIPTALCIFDSIIKKYSITEIYCKSFDYLLMKSCLVNKFDYDIIGALYRDYLDTEPVNFENYLHRFAETEDIPFLLKQDGELYETPEELEFFVNNRNVIMFFDNDSLVGCGYIIRVHENWNYFDIGMWTHPDHRHKGIGAYIIDFLKEFCLFNALKPICGCDYTNIASQKTLERCGFISKHNLLKFHTIKKASKVNE